MRRLGVVLGVVLMGLLCGARPAAAQTTVAGSSVLLNSSDANQLGTWLGEGPITLNRIYHKPHVNVRMSGGYAGYAEAFMTAVQNASRTLVVMEAYHGAERKLLGGYNPRGRWSPGFGIYQTPADADRTAFIFNLTNQVIYRQRLSHQHTGDPSVDPGRYQTFTEAGAPGWGVDSDLILANDLEAGVSLPYCYGPGANGDPIHGWGRNFDPNGNSIFEIGNVEVFEITSGSDASAVPEPGALALFLPALGVVAILRRRKS